MRRTHTFTERKQEDFLILSVGETIGDEFLFGAFEKLNYSIVTDSECDFYEIEVDKMKTLINENELIKNIMLKKSENKALTLQRRMECYGLYKSQPEELDQKGQSVLEKLSLAQNLIWE